MYKPKKNPAIQYITKLAFHKLPVSNIREYCTASNPKGLKNKGIYYSELYNVVDSEEWANLKPETGEGGGAKKSEEEKSKISNTMKGKKIVWKEEDVRKRNEKLKGRKMPRCKDETRKKISEANKGRILGVRTKESYIKANETKKRNGYKHSEETKLKIKQTLKGNKRPKEVVDKLGKKILVDDVLYSSMSEAERMLCKSRYMINKQHKIKLL